MFGFSETIPTIEKPALYCPSVVASGELSLRCQGYRKLLLFSSGGLSSRNESHTLFTYFYADVFDPEVAAMASEVEKLRITARLLSQLELKLTLGNHD
ncbi:hypothetical protein AVEN_56367-1 [Araneus ventricosus]|uniref:Uncharacterized protein n=1 Tax=Araneus ventricosus TaxID=182803 RepID=A0A4Y2Q1V2_ARAVE|nr:hypothetical protein AVEN_56367-1 [Araneus ventricosus]